MAADLVQRVEDWPGLLLAPGFTEAGTYERFRKPAYDRACACAQPGVEVDPAEFEETLLVDVVPPQLGLGDARELVHTSVGRRTELLAQERGQKPVLGAARVLKQKVFDVPRKSKRSPAPICHTSCPEMWRAFKDGWRAFETAYRQASAAFRAGLLHCPFPDWSFRPPLPIFLE